MWSKVVITVTVGRMCDSETSKSSRSEPCACFASHVFSEEEGFYWYHSGTTGNVDRLEIYLLKT